MTPESDQRTAVIDDIERTFELLAVESRHQFAERLRPFKLSIPQYLALYFIATKGAASSLSEVGAEIDAPPSSMTSIIDRLVHEGLVLRDPHPEDRRSITVTATPRGLELIDQLRQLRRADLAFMLDGLPNDDIGRFADMLRHLQKQTETLLREMRRDHETRSSGPRPGDMMPSRPS